MACEIHAARCALCQFNIDVTDEIATSPTRLPFHTSAADMYGPVDSSAELSSSLERITCRVTDCPEDHACHAFCKEKVDSASLQDLLQVTKHSHMIPEVEERRRRQWLRERLRSKLEAYYAQKSSLSTVESDNASENSCRLQNLSSDIWHLIADDLLPCYAVLRTQAILQIPGGSSISSITTAKEVWYGFLHFEGIRYISWVSNSPEKDGCLSLGMELGHAESRLLVIAENYLGITEVRLANLSELNLVSERTGIWWRTIPLNLMGKNLNVWTDVSYIPVRHLVLLTSSSSTRA